MKRLQPLISVVLFAVTSGTVEVIATADGVMSSPAIIQVESEQLTRTGTFQRSPGTSYRVEGSAELEDGGAILRFGDDFSCSNGPRLHVYLSKSSRFGGDSRDLGPLKSTAGTQSYTIPSTTNSSEFNYILVHCVPFNVTFGFAELIN